MLEAFFLPGDTEVVVAGEILISGLFSKSDSSFSKVSFCSVVGDTTPFSSVYSSFISSTFYDLIESYEPFFSEDFIFFSDDFLEGIDF